MSLAHSAFLFDYRAFQSAVGSLTAELDAGNPEPLRARVAEIRQRIGNSANWILHDRGTYLWDAVPAGDARFKSGLWGNWLLTILSTFLSPCIEQGDDWSKLSCTLHSLKWTDEDVWRLLTGLSTVWLLKLDASYQRGMVVEWSMPYWYWMRPDRSTYCGWLPVEEVERLRQRLLDDQHRLEEDLQTWIRLSPHVSAANAHISPDLNPDYWYQRIPIVYQQAVAMMSRASEAGVGLFSVVYQAYGDPEEWEQDETDEDQS